MKDTPRDSAHRFAPGQDGQRRSEKGDEDHNGHPTQKKHHRGPTAKFILGVCIDKQPDQLADDGRVGQTGLPGGRNNMFPCLGIVLAKAILELGLAVERGNLVLYQ